MTNGIKAIAIVLVVLLAAFASGLPVLFHLSYVLFAIVLLCSVWAIGNVRWMQVKRESRTLRTQVGGVVEEHFVVRNTSLIPKLWVEMKDNSNLPDHHVSRVFMLGSRAVKRITVGTVARKRGEYTLGPCTVASGDPFGIFRRSKTISQKSKLIVYPATEELPQFEIPVGELPGGYAMRQRTQQVTPMAFGVREYAPGDSINRIHWVSTARNGRLMTKEFELDPTSDIWILLDMDKKVQAGSDDDSTEEYGVMTAASLAKHFLDQNRSVGLIASGVHYEVIHSDRGMRQLLKILERLAVIKAAGKKPLAEIITAEEVRFGSNTTVITVSPSIDESWALALKNIRRRGVRTVAVILEANTFGGRGNSMLVVGELAVADTPTYLVKRGDVLGSVLVTAGSRD